MYIQPLYRPPSEANSLILQITLGCSHNKCTFCYMYKNKDFKIKSIENIKKHIIEAKNYNPNPRRIFLADGNVLCLSTEKILDILRLIKKYFPDVERISSYSGPLDLLRKSKEDLKLIKDSGLDMLYIGVESGSDEVLNFINKGVSQNEMIEAGKKAKNAGFILSCMIISGLGGKDFLKIHALESSKVISAINPDFFSLLTLLVAEGTTMKEMVDSGKFELLNPTETMLETKLMIENINLDNCVFRSNHASNYVRLKGILNSDKDDILNTINNALKNNNYVPESWRGL